MDLNGAVRHRQPLEKYEHFDNKMDADLSRDGSLMAVVITENKVGFLLRLFAESGIAKPSRQRLLVYDLAHGRKVWDLVLKPFPKQSARVALSPDGSRLALLRDGWLEIYPIAAGSNPTPVK